MGGLGNQLFQIFATISYALDIGQEFRLPYIICRGVYWDTFFLELQKYIIHYQPEININEDKFNYVAFNNEIDKSKNILLYGYFQSYKYFSHNFNKICEIIGLKNNIELFKNNLRLANSGQEYDFNNTISLHFRLGDYKYFPLYHLLITNNYYIKALNHIIDKDKFVIIILVNILNFSFVQYN